MSKVKVRCTNCGKWFQSANAKDTLCHDCAQKAKKEKQAAKAAPPTEVKPSLNRPVPSPPPPKPKRAQGGTNQWLDTVSDVKVGQPDQPARPKIPSSPTQEIRSGPGTVVSPANYRTDRGPGSDTGNTVDTSGATGSRDRERESNSRGPGNYREGGYRPPYRVIGGDGLPEAPRPRQPMDREGRGPRPGGDFRPSDRGNRPNFRDGKPGGRPKVKTPKPPPPPKPKKEKIPPPQPFVPTPEQITQVETRYLELAQPEYDGIRTQIAHELGIPKKAVKQIVKNLRDSQHIPSWWDNQSYSGSEEDLARIRELYEPTLPLPDIGVHKKIAEQLSLKPVDVYQAIKMIRAQMNLPQYNDPALHGIELKPRQPKKASNATGEETSETTDEIVEETQAEQLIPTDDISTMDTAAVVESTQEPESATTQERSEPAPPEQPIEVEQSISTEA